MDEYADVLERCQQAALLCQERFEHGQALNAQASTDWRNAPRFVAGNLVIDRPGDGLIAGAERDFARVVSDLNVAGDECARALHVACTNAPRERSWWDQVGAFAGGALEAAVEYSKLLTWPITANAALVGQAYDVWRGKLTLAEAASLQMRPVEMVADLAQAGWHDPWSTAGSVMTAAVDAQTWMDDPARAAGRLAPDALVGAMTGGVASTLNRASKIGVKGDDIAAGLRGAFRVNDPPQGSLPHHGAGGVSHHAFKGVKHAPPEPGNHFSTPGHHSRQASDVSTASPNASSRGSTSHVDHSAGNAIEEVSQEASPRSGLTEKEQAIRARIEERLNPTTPIESPDKTFADRVAPSSVESILTYDPHSTQPSDLPTLLTEEEIAAATRPIGLSDEQYEKIRLERTQAPKHPQG